MRKNNYSKYEVLTLEDAGMHVEYSDQEHIDFVLEMEEENRQDVISLANEIAELVEKKDKDYNSAFSKTLKEYGDVAYFLRIDDKLNRLKSLLLDNKDAEVNESVEDTLKDIVGYTLLMLKEKRA